MTKTFTIQDFFKRFPDDTACLDHLMKLRYGDSLDCPKCGKHGRFTRIRKMPAYQCAWCGHHIHPMAGTPFEELPNPAPVLVLRDVPVHHNSAWRTSEGVATPAWHNVQNSVAHGT